MNPEATEIRRSDIRSATARRLVQALNAEMLERYPEDGTADLFKLELDIDEVAQGQGLFLVAYSDGVPLACGALKLLDPDTAEIRRMYVDPRGRGRGLGRRLLAALEAEARLLGAEQLVLGTGPRQPDAIALYINSGFSEIEAFGGYETHPLNLFMGKRLKKSSAA